jgi:hypothetical protein
VAAAIVAAASLGLVIYGTGSRGLDISTVASSPLFYIGVTAAFLASVWAAWLVETHPAAGSAVPFGIVMAGAVILRLMALPAAPGLTDDIYRYLWDGQVQARGINPFLHPPEAAELDGVETGYRSLINNPELPTIYPPVSQMVFLAATLMGGTVIGMKSLLLLFDLGTILALAAILKHRGMAPSRVVIYAWSPIAVIEVGWNGHQDPIGVCLLMIAALGIIKGRSVVSITAAALSGAAKYIGWLSLPAAVKRSRWLPLLALPAALALVYAPYASAGAGVLGSLLAYAERWRFNDSIFALLLRGVERLDLTEHARSALLWAGWLDPAARWESSVALRLTEPLSLAKWIGAGLFIAFAVRILRRAWTDPLREILGLLGAALLLAPVLHPWYLLWIAPFMAVLPRVSWLWLTYAILVTSYPMMATRTSQAEPLGWLVFFEYVPFFVILAVESARRRLWEMDGEGWRRADSRPGGRGTV